jgi:hypothetical protein
VLLLAAIVAVVTVAATDSPSIIAQLPKAPIPQLVKAPQVVLDQGNAKLKSSESSDGQNAAVKSSDNNGQNAAVKSNDNNGQNAAVKSSETIHSLPFRDTIPFNPRWASSQPDGTYIETYQMQFVQKHIQNPESITVIAKMSDLVDVCLNLHRRREIN